MDRKTYRRARTAAHELGDVTTQINDLQAMTVGDLAAKYRELYGEPTRTRNKAYLKKRLRWRIEELQDGGLSPRAVELITQLGDGIPERWRVRQAGTDRLPMPEAPKDPRLPPVGSVLRRTYKGVEHEVVVAIDGSWRGRCQGHTYASPTRARHRAVGFQSRVDVFGCVDSLHA